LGKDGFDSSDTKLVQVYAENMSWLLSRMNLGMVEVFNTECNTSLGVKAILMADLEVFKQRPFPAVFGEGVSE
jgi:hypothetical protein